MRILIAYDGSECGDLMLDDLRRAGLPENADVLILSVAERWLSQPESEVVLEHLSSQETAYALAARASARLTQSFPSWSILIEAAMGSPAETIIDRAREWNADLITLGSLGHSALERMLIGSVSYKVANEAPCSVRICRGRGAAHNAKVRILLGYDGMPGAESAARVVGRRQWPDGTKVRLLTVVGFGHSPVAELGMPKDYDRTRQIQASAERVLRDSGLEVSALVLEGDPKLVIIDQANAFDADSIFVGHNDRQLAYRLFLGTVASTVVPRAACSVEIVRS